MVKQLFEEDKQFIFFENGKLVTRMYVDNILINDIFWSFCGDTTETEFWKMPDSSNWLKVQPNTFKKRVFY